jgi:hypothetical protein
MGTNTQQRPVPASWGAAAPGAGSTTPARLSFRPWGRRKVGDPDPEAPGYQRLDGHVVHAHGPTDEPPYALRFRDLKRRVFAVTDADDMQMLYRDRRLEGGPVVPVGSAPVVMLHEPP